MSAAIDLGSEMLVDRSQIQDPYLRLLVTAIGQELISGSAWIVLDKQAAAKHDPLLPLVRRSFSRMCA